MPAKRKKERIIGTYFIWLLGQRHGVYCADGRSNRIDAGRHSLGTKDRNEALEALKRLDLVRAVDLGLADRSLLTAANPQQLSLQDGRSLYLKHVTRPRVVGGARPTSAKRYRAVFDKFEAFAQKEGIASWNQVNHRTLEAYAAHLDDGGYAYATEYLELTTLKQAVKWLVEEGHLPSSCIVRMPLAKPHGTSTYCWRREEVEAMVQYCRRQNELHWLSRLIMAMACTGMRISEMASLRWTDIDQAKKITMLTDESTLAQRQSNHEARQTKSGRSRSFPIHEGLRVVFSELSISSDGLVFHGPLGGRLKADTVRRSLIRDVLTPLKKQFTISGTKVGFANGRLHSFRHYFCSTCANSGVPEQVVMEWLGHRDSAMVRHYYHLHDDESQRQMQRLDFVGEAGGNVAAGEVS